MKSRDSRSSRDSCCQPSDEADVHTGRDSSRATASLLVDAVVLVEIAAAILPA